MKTSRSAGRSMLEEGRPGPVRGGLEVEKVISRVRRHPASQGLKLPPSRAGRLVYDSAAGPFRSPVCGDCGRKARKCACRPRRKPRVAIAIFD